MSRGGAKLYTFPLKGSTGEVFLYCLKMQKFYPLISSDDSLAVRSDSQFYVMEANRNVFDNDKLKEDLEASNVSDEEQDEVHARFKGKKKCTVVFI